jgi:hypothetical protein
LHLTRVGTTAHRAIQLAGVAREGPADERKTDTARRGERLSVLEPFGKHRPLRIVHVDSQQVARLEPAGRLAVNLTILALNGRVAVENIASVALEGAILSVRELARPFVATEVGDARAQRAILRGGDVARGRETLVLPV